METLPEPYQPKDSFLRLATACPEVNVADVATNVQRITNLYEQASDQNVSLLTFPELSITGYTLGDLVNQTRLLDQAKEGLLQLAEVTANKETAMVVGLPLQVNNRLYNCAAVLAKGSVVGIVPKTFRPNYNEFYEQRWYDRWEGPNTQVHIRGSERQGQLATFGTDMLFDVSGVQCGVEICEDLWVMDPPSTQLAAKGALVITNPSASPEQIGKAEYRRNLVAMHSARLLGAYAYAGCHTTESTAEIVMGGHQMIAANGQLLAERKPFGTAELTIADVDIDHLLVDRRKQHAANLAGAVVLHTFVSREQSDLLHKIESNPFLPEESLGRRSERLEAALNIQAHGLAMRMRASNQNKVILGLSGGLDSTLALIVAHKAADILGLPTHDMIHTITMPGPASSEMTQDNAQILAKQLDVQNTVIPIGNLVATELTALGHDGVTQDITYENVQARARTNILFNYGNKNGGLVLGTGDLSEIALGWCTYNGDQQSHYNVNASIPKTLVRHLVAHAAKQPQYADARTTLDDILGTVVSPELTTSGEGEISQSTEDIIGPYELHDFFLYHLIRWGDSPEKIRFLANQAFDQTYSAEDIDACLYIFLGRFARNQFKRENMPNGPKVGSVSLSPRGDWRMPPDLINPALWS
jgi:NAD+ synthase (glutamine-hydrolysing)